MAVAIPRSTTASSLDVSQSQVTAPVFEYRCMFTHDVHKKQKKWHDGTLRFHTFNKRVMVYDDSKNFVGDLHYRLAEEFGEGLELRLERPVLVQVEEQLGQTKTDLTSLLGRQKQSGNTQYNTTGQPTRAMLSRINAANPQVKPKSIKELLGASQGRLGRARLATQSPYEQRQALSEVQPNEPAAKRRKIGDGKGNGSTAMQPSAEPVLPKQHVPKRVQAERPMTDEVVELSSDEGGTDASRITEKRKGNAIGSSTVATVTKPGSSSISQEVPKSGQRLKLPNPKPRKSTSTRNRPNGQGDPERRKKASKDKVHEQDRLARTASSSETSEAFSVSAVSERLQPTGPRSSLKFATQKPRLKLMYIALLPGASFGQATNSSTAQNTAATSTANLTTVNTIRKRRPQTSAIDVDNFFAASQIANAAADDVHSSPQRAEEPISADAEAVLETTLLQPMPKNGIGNRLGEEAANEEDTAMVADSPLFMPRTASQISPLPTQDFTTGDLELPLLSQAAPENTSQRQKVREADVEDATQHIVTNKAAAAVFTASRSDFKLNVLSGVGNTSAENIPNAEMQATDHMNQMDPEMAPAANIATSRPPILCKETPSRCRPFRRVVSENLPNNDAGFDALFDDFDDDPNGGLQPNRTTPRMNHYRNPVPPLQLRQATSDSIVLEAIMTVREPAEESELPHHAVPQQEAEERVQLRVPPASQTEQRPQIVTGAGNILEDTGAWTSTEAFLLFDWWPPGKQKPDYGQERTLREVTSGGANAAVGSMASIDGMSKKKYGMFGSARLVSQR